MTLIERIKCRQVPMQYSYGHFNDDQETADILAEAKRLLNSAPLHVDQSTIYYPPPPSRDAINKWTKERDALIAKLRGTSEREKR